MPSGHVSTFLGPPTQKDLLHSDALTQACPSALLSRSCQQKRPLRPADHCAPVYPPPQLWDPPAGPRGCQLHAGTTLQHVGVLRGPPSVTWLASPLLPLAVTLLIWTLVFVSFVMGTIFPRCSPFHSGRKHPHAFPLFLPPFQRFTLLFLSHTIFCREMLPHKGVPQLLKSWSGGYLVYL